MFCGRAIKGEEDGAMHVSVCALNHCQDSFCFSLDILSAKEWKKNFCCKKTSSGFW